MRSYPRIPEISKQDLVGYEESTENKKEEMAMEIYIRMVASRVNPFESSQSKAGVLHAIKETAELAASFYFKDESE